ASVQRGILPLVICLASGQFGPCLGVAVNVFTNTRRMLPVIGQCRFNLLAGELREGAGSLFEALGRAESLNHRAHRDAGTTDPRISAVDPWRLAYFSTLIPNDFRTHSHQPCLSRLYRDC